MEEKNMKYKLKIVCGTLLFLLIGCQVPEGGGSPFDMLPSIPDKILKTDYNTPVELVSYVDVEHYNPLNAKDYVFTSTTGITTQFFNYVVLAYSYLTRTENGYIQIEMSPVLKYILDNSTTYIKPLHQKGIRVLIEVRSGNFDDTEDGVGVGLGTMDMAAINKFTTNLKSIVNQYGIDGFDFNDVGGGKKAYPPLTRDLTEFRSTAPLYPEEEFFKNPDGTSMSDDEIEAVLWAEGGSNLAGLAYRTYEALKETYTWTYNDLYYNDSEASKASTTKTVKRIIMVRNKNHGAHLPYYVREAYMPDAYTGADTSTPGNLSYIVNGDPYDNTQLHASMWNDKERKDSGGDADNKYAPFAVDLSDQKDKATAEKWANTFVLKDPDGSSADSSNWNRYGALYFTNLPPVSDTAGKIAPAAYMTYFSQALFGRTTRLAETPNAGDYKKTW
jgi:hypothetical protein